MITVLKSASIEGRSGCSFVTGEVEEAKMLKDAWATIECLRLEWTLKRRFGFVGYGSCMADNCSLKLPPMKHTTSQ